MSFINQISDIAPLAVLSGFSSIETDGAVSSQLSATLAGTSQIFATLSAANESAATIAGTSQIFADGRINAEPNIFGAAILPGDSQITATARKNHKPFIVLPGNSQLAAAGFIRQAQASHLLLFVQITPEPSGAFNKTYSARITADGANIPITSFDLSAAANDAGMTVNFTLARTSDTAAIESAFDFTFQIYDGGAWQTVFSAGRRTANAFAISFADGRAANSATLSTAAPVSEKLNLSPVNSLTVYDRSRMLLDESEFESLFDTDGNEYPHELEPVIDLTLYKLLEKVFIEKCGFADYQTNLPDFPVRRVDFDDTTSYFESIAGHIGIFEPLIFVENDIVWILDATNAHPAGFPAAISLEAKDFKAANLTRTKSEIDGYNLQYAQDERFFDYFINKELPLDIQQIGTYGTNSYSEIWRLISVREYYKLSAPFAPVKTEKTSEKRSVYKTYSGVLTLQSEETENFLYDSLGRINQTTKIAFSLIPNLTGGATQFVQTKDENKQYGYKADIINRRRQVLNRITTRLNGLVINDENNLQLGTVFKQEFGTANRSGNLIESQSLTFEPIRTISEKFTQKRNGEIERSVIVTDHLTPEGTTDGDGDNTPGDLSFNSQTSEAKITKVFRAGAIATNRKMQSLSIGEMPLNLGIALARRKLAKSDFRRGTVNLIGLKTHIRRGSEIVIFNQSGAEIGNFLVEGFSMSGANLGTVNQVTSQTLEIKEI